MPRSPFTSANLPALIKRILALSAAINLHTIEEKDPNGHYIYGRGRHKYYGLGALVIFFALFSCYGMAHMLATMPTITAMGAVAGGVLWGGFQWLLERQIIMSIAPDARWFAKLSGFGWRSIVAVLSVTTMVYPFFVESNRAEIDVRAGEMARARLIDNLQSAQQAVGLPALQILVAAGAQKLQKAETELSAEPPELPALRQQARLCWSQFRDTEARAKARIAQLSEEKRIVDSSDAAALSRLNAGIAALAARIGAGKSSCHARDRSVADRLAAWKQEKATERNAVALENRQIGAKVEAADVKGKALESEQAAKIERAARSGFAADFEAVWSMLQHDPSRRTQFIWWFAWFLAIELIVMIVKLTSFTDLDCRFGADEALVKQQIQHDLAARLTMLQTAGLRAQTEAKGTQAALQQDDGQAWQQMEARRLDLALYQEELKAPAELAQTALLQMLRMQNLGSEGLRGEYLASFETVLNRAVQDVLSVIQRNSQKACVKHQ
ncbi:DUF4407 domain-containing protein [Undibacterium sp.]|jgi:hypothetical protein|uniref:DUF4407 domain-containing protein n=1 Tax=Undibacterium sp. TaxID=1914977 RepID=UPI002C5CC0E9|nr:DUF4407 domain-containing protein [Undibacterium sp.]HTD04718.1 DUF4407 domain-containing protein [Undibacterium sp.]